MQRSWKLTFLMACSASFSIEPRTTSPGLTLPTMDQALPQRSLNKKCLTGLWRNFSTNNSYFQYDSSLCQVETKLARTSSFSRKTDYTRGILITIFKIPYICDRVLPNRHEALGSILDLQKLYNSRENLKYISKGDRNKNFNLLSQIGASLSQMRPLSEIMHIAVLEPMRRYLYTEQRMLINS